jgi:hypothetical protein
VGVVVMPLLPGSDCFWSGLDHGVGHSLLLLDDAKAPNCQKSQYFKGLGHYPCNTILISF